MDPRDKRLAMQVDDHSISWGDAAGHASSWLEYADTGDPVATRPESVLSGRTIAGIQKGMPPRGVKKGTKRARTGESRTRSRMNKSQLQRAVDAKKR